MRWTLFALALAGCGLPECEALCAERAACIQADIDAADSSWTDWTGFPDGAAYERACLDPFEDSLDRGASRDDVLDLCDAEQDAGACAGT